MVDRIKTTHGGETRRPRHPQTFSFKQIDQDRAAIDELIVSLAHAHENRRAQQVNEWERMHRTPRIST